MAVNKSNNNATTLWDISRAAGLGSNTNIGKVIEIMDQENPIIQDMPMVQANHTDKHMSESRSGIPKPTWTKLYQGLYPQKDSVTPTEDSLGRMEARSECDHRMLDHYDSKEAKERYRSQKDHAFVEGMHQEFARQLFYGDVNSKHDKFEGLHTRYNSLSADVPSSANVIDAGGTTENKCTSIWLVRWGDQRIHGLYPKGAKVGLSRTDVSKELTYELDPTGKPTGGKYYVDATMWSWMMGLAVPDWRHVVRICNIDLTKCGPDISKQTTIDLTRLVSEAVDLLPTSEAPAVFYMNKKAMGALKRQTARATSSSTLTTENLNGRLVKVVEGCVMKACDAIALDEKVIKG